MLLLTFALAGVSTAPAAPFTALRDGESFTYRVGFAMFPRAGELVIAARGDRDSAGRPLLRVATTISSRGLVRDLYELDNQAEGLVDLSTGRLLAVRESGREGRRTSDSETIFDYESRLARHVDRSRPGRSVDLAIPEGDPIDLISALVQTRDWDLRPGESRAVLVHFGRDLYPLRIHAEEYAEVRTPLGRFRTLVLVPRMEGTPKGLFKRGGQIRVWIAQEGARLPVKMQLVLKVGTASLFLTRHEAPPATGTN